MTKAGKIWAWRAAALVATGYLVAMYLTGALPQSRQLIQFDARGVLEVDGSQIQRVTLTADDHVFRYSRVGGTWVRDHDKASLPAEQAASLERALKFMHTSAPVRTFAQGEWQPAELAQYGLDRPRLAIGLFSQDKPLLRAQFGELNASGFLQYMQVEGRSDLFLISRFVGAEWAAVAAVSGKEENHHHGRLPVR